MATQPADMSCPYCRGRMRPVKAACPECGVAVEGEFRLPRVALLSPDEAAFLAEFVLAGFSIKALEQRVGMSYPAARARLDRIIEHMRDLSAGAEERKAVLDRLESGDIRADDAIRLIEAIR
jgi:hypothetical protein